MDTSILHLLYMLVDWDIYTSICLWETKALGLASALWQVNSKNLKPSSYETNTRQIDGQAATSKNNRSNRSEMLVVTSSVTVSIAVSYHANLIYSTSSLSSTLPSYSLCSSFPHHSSVPNNLARFFITQSSIHYSTFGLWFCLLEPRDFFSFLFSGKLFFLIYSYNQNPFISQIIISGLCFIHVSQHVQVGSLNTIIGTTDNIIIRTLIFRETNLLLSFNNWNNFYVVLRIIYTLDFAFICIITYILYIPRWRI